jgi:hypothetical protein
LLQLTELGLKATRERYEVVEGLTKKSKEEVFLVVLKLKHWKRLQMMKRGSC